MRVRLLVVGALVVGIVPALALGSGTKVLSTKLTGGAETPKGAPAGSGKAQITITGTKVCWHFEAVKGTDTPLAAHIHKGAPGKAGPVVVPLGAAYKASGCTTSPVGPAVAAHPGQYYVNVHTKRYPGGAVRGQLGPSVAGSSPPGASTTPTSTGGTPAYP